MKKIVVWLTREKKIMRGFMVVCILTVLDAACSNVPAEIDTDESEPLSVPECKSSTVSTAPDEDDDAGDLVSTPGDFIPNSCDSSMFRMGVSKNCALGAKGTLEINDSVYDLSWGCIAETGIYDMTGDNYYIGLNARFITGGECDPLINLGIVDIERFDTEPFTVALDERICTGAKTHLISFMLKWKDICYSLNVNPSGSLFVEKLEHGITYKGHIDATLLSASGEEIAVKFDFKLDGMAFIQEQNESDYWDLCALE